MEDAMILSKSSYERGFAHASVYKTKIVDLAEERKRSAKPGSGTGGGGLKFGNYAPRNKLGRSQQPPKLRSSDDGDGGGGDDDGGGDGHAEVKVYAALDDDGLPHVGDFVREGDPLVCVVDELTGEAKAALKHKENEPAYVQCVRALGAVDSAGGGAGGGGGGGSSSSNGSTAGGSKKGREPLSRVAITLRFTRNPIIGDKFSSRHGQKGVMSILWPQVQRRPTTKRSFRPCAHPHVRK
jgi:DNA-directed RNA polymerase I subunit RPA2